jgi:hypothetical protein
MMTHGFPTGSPVVGSLPRGTATTADASILITMLWPAILAMAAVGGSLALTCVAPFAAFAVATAGTLRFRSALGTMTVIWLANQAVGFGALGYPWTLNTVLWGLAIGAAAGLATLTASGTLHRFRSSEGWLRLPLAFGTALSASSSTPRDVERIYRRWSSAITTRTQSGVWGPHCTLATRVDASRLSDAIAAAATLTLPWVAAHMRLAIVQFDQTRMETLKVLILMANSRRLDGHSMSSLWR